MKGINQPIHKGAPPPSPPRRTEPKSSKNTAEKEAALSLFKCQGFAVSVFAMIIKILRRLGFWSGKRCSNAVAEQFFLHRYSKFVLGCFRFHYQVGEASKKQKLTEDLAHQILVTRLSDFLRKYPECLYRAQHGSHRDLEFNDIIETDFDDDGNMVSLTTHFDNSQPGFSMINDDLQYDLLSEILSSYSKYRDLDDRQRHDSLLAHLENKFIKNADLTSKVKREAHMFIERVLNGTYIHFEELPRRAQEAEKVRLVTPPFESRKRPGLGLLNLCCRFTADYKEADLWFEYNHVPVKGTPLQGILDDLNADWGTAGPMLFPSINSDAARPERRLLKNDVYRVRAFFDFSHILSMRERINRDHESEMRGHATFVSLLIWGLAHHDPFREQKFLLPVNVGDPSTPTSMNTLDFISLQPGEFISDNKHEGFINFQQYLNYRIFQKNHVSTDSGTGTLEDLILTNPLLFSIAQRVMPDALEKLTDGVCFSNIRNAEVFMAPFNDSRTNSFITVGVCNKQTRDGHTVGAISVSGAREQVEEYMQIFQSVVDDYECYV